MPNFSCSTLATGARQLVVQLALEMHFIAAVSLSSFTPSTQVRSAAVLGRGAEHDLFGPGLEVRVVAGLPVLRPGGEETRAFDDHIGLQLAPGQFGRILDLRGPNLLPVDDQVLSSWATVPLKRRCVLSYFSSVASILVSVRSLIATTSNSRPAGRQNPKHQPPNPPKSVDANPNSHGTLLPKKTYKSPTRQRGSGTPTRTRGKAFFCLVH